ncbi:MAG: glycosyltransferase [Pseudomonadota bacterium]
MRIVDVAEFYSKRGGGVRTYIDQKIEASRQEGCETIVIAPGEEDLFEPRAGGGVFWVKSPRLMLDSRYYAFNRAQAVHELINDIAPDVVEGSSPWKGGRIVGEWQGPAVKSFFIHQDPVAVYPHTFLEGWLRAERIDKLFTLFWRYMRSLIERFDTSIVSGEWLADRFEAFGVRRPHAVPFGVDKQAFSPDRRDESLRRQMLAQCGVTAPDAKLLVAVSRHHPEKRLGMVMKGFREASQRRPMGLFLIGDGPFRGFVERQARRTPGVHVAGLVTDRHLLSRYLASGDAFLHGSSAETYGLVVAEAMCSGLPLIVPAKGGAGELAGPDYAELFRPGDAGGCAEAIGRALARDWSRMSEASYAASRHRIGLPKDHFKALFAHYDSLRAAARVKEIAPQHRAVA